MAENSKIDVNTAASAIMQILRQLPSPRVAAAAIAVVRANLHRQAGADTTVKLAAMMNDDDRATLEIWETIVAFYDPPTPVNGQ